MHEVRFHPVQKIFQCCPSPQRKKSRARQQKSPRIFVLGPKIMRELASCREHTATSWPPSLVTPSGGLLLLPLLLHLLIFDNCHETAVPAIHSLHQAMRRTTIGSFERS